MASKRDFYETLGVSKDAQPAEIKRAYRRLVKEFHPDHNKAADAADKFKEIQEAYEVLSHEDKRQVYDKFGHAGVEGGFGGANGQFGDFGQMGGMGGGFSNFSDFEGMFGGSDMSGLFENFFSAGMGGRRARGPRAGADLSYNMTITLEEAAFGADKEISYKREVTCKKCDGTGSKNKKLKECSTCKGSGQVRTVQQTILGSISVASPCPECKGEGKIPEEICDECNGSGVKEETEKLSIKIPKGSHDGIQFRFKEKGDAGEKGGNYGDLYLNLNVKEHELFTREGDDIVIQYRVPLASVVLGDEVDIPTLHGEEKMKIPAGTQYGETIVLKDKGIPHRTTSGNGDQHVKVVFDIPKKLGREEKEMWEKMKK